MCPRSQGFLAANWGLEPWPSRLPEPLATSPDGAQPPSSPACTRPSPAFPKPSEQHCWGILEQFSLSIFSDWPAHPAFLGTPGINADTLLVQMQALESHPGFSLTSLKASVPHL